VDNERQHLLRDADARRHLGLATPLAVERGRGGLDACGARVELDIDHRFIHATVRFSTSSSTGDNMKTAPCIARDIDVIFAGSIAPQIMLTDAVLSRYKFFSV
jgi:hypothetical protein